MNVKVFSDKRLESLRQNGSFNTSKIEQQLIEYLDSLNMNYVYQYNSERYPFNCDFYFPDYDLFVEIQGSWTHGGHPYNAEDPEDQEKLEYMKEKAESSDFYKNAINVWTNRDVKKREIAKRNCLNYLEVFSCNLEEVTSKIKEKIEIK